MRANEITQVVGKCAEAGTEHVIVDSYIVVDEGDDSIDVYISREELIVLTAEEVWARLGGKP